MIQLEHINLVVSDVDAMLHFYGAAFPHWHIRSQGTGDWNGKPRRWLHFGDDYNYIALSDNGEGDNRDLSGHQVGLAHFAFVTHDLAAMINRLEAAGYDIHKAGADNQYRKNIYFLDPQGFEVEFVEYLSDIPAERNSDD
ncbi:VOC family protein [Kangiella sp. TOML190]|uniref:VOC family protein n=1 Tax=Kangiella sp. TOML190 TaxID=2931351 RepID=UPI00203D8E4E|nr:VOC family protein [Kangiella sp. TOML190]